MSHTESSYRPCACRDCFETAIGEPGAMCHECEEAGCEPDSECQAPGAYGGEETDPSELPASPEDWKGIQGTRCEKGYFCEGNWPCRYGDWRTTSVGPWLVPDYTCGSDYSGGTVKASNFRVFEREFEAGADSWWCAVTGRHGTFAVVLDMTKAPRAALEFFAALEDYPCADESDLSELEAEREDEAWENWARSDFRREIEKRFELELSDGLPDERLYEIFHEACEASGQYWEHTSEGPYIDMRRVVTKVSLEALEEYVVKDELREGVLADLHAIQIDARIEGDFDSAAAWASVADAIERGQLSPLDYRASDYGGPSLRLVQLFMPSTE